jgi:hypothetical protein
MNQANFDIRALYYLCTKFCSGYAADGSKYKGIKPTRMMCLIGFSLFDNVKCRLHDYSMKNRYGRRLFNKPMFELGFFEYCKDNVNDNLQHVAKFLSSGKAEANYPEFLKKAAEIVRIENLNEKEREAMRLYETLEERISLSTAESSN